MKTNASLMVVFFALLFSFGAKGEEKKKPDEGEKAGVAKEVVQALTSKELDEEAFREGILTRFDKSAIKRKLSVEARASLRGALVQSLARVTNDRLVEILAKPYENEFTLEELKSIRDFYRSPAGKALLQKHGAISQAQENAKQLFTDDLFQEVAQQMNEAKEKAKE